MLSEQIKSPAWWVQIGGFLFGAALGFWVGVTSVCIYLVVTIRGRAFNDIIPVLPILIGAIAGAIVGGLCSLELTYRLHNSGKASIGHRLVTVGYCLFIITVAVIIVLYRKQLS